jgi:hypothetical protein
MKPPRPSRSADLKEEGTEGMKRFLLVAIVASAMMALASPGTVAAAPGGNAEAAKECLQSYGDRGFRNPGECVSFFARGLAHEPFQMTCVEFGGTFFTSLRGLAPACEWVTDNTEQWLAAREPLEALCPKRTALVGGATGGGESPIIAIWGCE